MTCRDVDKFLADYLDGDMPAAVRLRFTAHLIVCADCRRYIDTYRKTISLGRAALVETETAPPVPDALVRAILASRKPTDIEG